mmetsp:Transcript_67830/g.176543  ORF Transcript_67830/g.176543 Transcript_67830/m.176543 type:complete len:204 (+) Transcript_67830:96-707(+)
MDSVDVCNHHVDLGLPTLLPYRCIVEVGELYPGESLDRIVARLLLEVLRVLQLGLVLPPMNAEQQLHVLPDGGQHLEQREALEDELREQLILRRVAGVQAPHQRHDDALADLLLLLRVVRAELLHREDYLAQGGLMLQLVECHVIQNVSDAGNLVEHEQQTIHRVLVLPNFRTVFNWHVVVQKEGPIVFLVGELANNNTELHE